MAEVAFLHAITFLAILPMLWTSVEGFIPLSPCELIFPKLGDFLSINSPTYHLLMCHFSSEIELLLDQNDRQFSVISHALVLHPVSMQYVNVVDFPPISLYTPPNKDIKLTTVSDFVQNQSGLVVNQKYKFVHQIFVGDIQVDQVSTVVTYMADDYFMNKLGLDRVKLAVSVSDDGRPCHRDEEGGYNCPWLETAAMEHFTEQFDFIEVGTSAFDTLIQRAKPEHRGISVEPLSFYQDLLPNPPGVIKENAAMSAVTSHDDTDTNGGRNFGLMYHFSPQDLQAHGFVLGGPHEYMFGISSFGSIQQPLLNAYRLEVLYAGTPSIFFQRATLVARLTMEDLYRKHAVREVGVVKLDCEGLDSGIVSSHLDMLQKYRLPFPCVIQYEESRRKVGDGSTMRSDCFLSTVRRLQGVGYRVMSITPSVEEHGRNVGDFVALHHECSDQRRRSLEEFLPKGSELAEELCWGQQQQPAAAALPSSSAQGYCCLSLHKMGTLEQEIGLCNSHQMFFHPERIE